jgi:FkbM family methyltransferase
VWCRATAWLRPTLVADVGLNYGECLFSGRYPEARRIVGIEANPALLPFALKTREGHPDAARIELVNALAGAVSAGEQAFYVNREWSGGSTPVAGIAGRAPERFHVEQVPTLRVETLFTDATRADRLLFKVDVEGYEPPVLRGMAALLEQVGCAVGYVEFDSGFLRAAGEDPAGFVDTLLERFNVYDYRHRGGLARVTSAAALATPGRHTDLLLAAGLDAAREAQLVRAVAAG